jgi:hypothetical protein
VLCLVFDFFVPPLLPVVVLFLGFQCLFAPLSFPSRLLFVLRVFLYSSLTAIILGTLWSGRGNWSGPFLLSVDIQVFEYILQEMWWFFVQA